MFYGIVRVFLTLFVMDKYYENKLKRIGTCAGKILFLNKHQISMILMVISCMKTLKTKNAADVV